MESKAVGFEQWNKAYGFGLRIPNYLHGENKRKNPRQSV